MLSRFTHVLRTNNIARATRCIYLSVYSISFNPIIDPCTIAAKTNGILYLYPNSHRFSLLINCLINFEDRVDFEVS